MRTRFLLAFLLVAATSSAAVLWRHPLSYDGGGYWDTRVRVDVTNAGDKALEGALVHIPLRSADATAALLDAPAASLRVVADDGAELIFDLMDAEGRAKRSGTLVEGDVVAAPVAAAPKSSATVYL